MADCCLIKKVATVEVYENKNEVRAYGFMAGDRNTPVMEVRFKHLWGESNLSTCKLRWIIVDDVGSLLVGEVPIQSDNTALINLPNELFTGDRRMKVQLTVASCDGNRILNLQQFTDLKVINNLASNEVVEPVYQMLINQVYDDTKKYLAELETSYKAKYGSLESVYAKSKASLEQYLINVENGGNAEFLQGYNPKNFNRVENTINELVNSASSKYKVGDVVEVLGYYTAGDGAHHKRKIESADDGSGVQLANGLWANIVHSGEVNMSWFGAKSDFDFNSSVGTDCSVELSKCIDYSNKRASMQIVVDGSFYIGNPITTHGQLNLVGRSTPSRMLIKNDTSYDIIRKPASSIYVRSGITAITMNGTGGSGITDPRDTHINISKINLIGGSINGTQFIRCTTCAPSRPGFCKTVEATGFENVFLFDFYDDAPLYGTNYYNFQIDDGCNFYGNKNAIKTVGRPTTSPSIGGLSMANSVFEQGARLELKNLFGYNEIKNCLLEGQSDVLNVSGQSEATNISIEGNYFEANSGNFNFSDCSISLKNNYFYNNTFYVKFSRTNIKECDIPPSHIKGFYSCKTNLDTYLNTIGKVTPESIVSSYGLCILDCKSHLTGGSSDYSNSILFTKKDSNTKYVDNKLALNLVPKSNSSVYPGNYKAINIEKDDIVVLKFYKSAGSIGLTFLGTGGVGNIGLVVGNAYYDEGYYILAFKAANPTNSCLIYGNSSSDVYISQMGVEVFKPDDFSTLKIRDIDKLKEVTEPLPFYIETLDTPYYATKMQQEGIYEDYVAYRDELHEYEKAQSQVDETMLLPVLHEPVIPESVKAFAEKYKLV